MRVMGEVLLVLAPLLASSSTYSLSKVHNILALMLDVRFKSLDMVKTFVRWAKVIPMVVKCDTKVLIPLLLVMFQFQILEFISFLN